MVFSSVPRGGFLVATFGFKVCIVLGRCFVV